MSHHSFIYIQYHQSKYERVHEEINYVHQSFKNAIYSPDTSATSYPIAIKAGFA
ncbi:hypothetical protein BD770DRAFT_377092 [Pilaira anomala]|nr:hypothetical protein BD770DRAFT_401721 [Pilaira anomala]KAI9361711.1 hypothetical protein BD770DRAFT_382541 [Pilaira anomala]KAI9365575.1 hypothetical protein BD770DRAFT_376780 [Pilaira anomala]KAI9365697.1 hypothetical protein BD770DRAFT_377092 [Pilaira anomala]